MESLDTIGKAIAQQAKQAPGAPRESTVAMVTAAEHDMLQRSIRSAVEFQKRSIANAKRAIEGEPQQAIERSWPWMRARTQENDNALLDTTLSWMARLSKDVRPMVLAARYPRIANSIANIWRRVARCEEYLDTLVVDRRGNRKGFSPDVAQELKNLRGYYAKLHPANCSGRNRVGAAN